MARNRMDEERYAEWRKRARQGGPDGDGGVGRVSDVRDEFLADRASPVRQLIGTAAGLSDASGSPFAAFGSRLAMRPFDEPAAEPNPPAHGAAPQSGPNRPATEPRDDWARGGPPRQEIPAQDRIALAFLRGSMGTDAIRRHNEIASRYGLPTIPQRETREDRIRRARFGGDFTPLAGGGMGNRMTGDMVLPPAAEPRASDRLIQDGTGRWFDPARGQYVTPEPPEKFSGSPSGQVVGDRGTVRGDRTPRLEPRGDGTFIDANTGQVVGEPTGSARYKPTGVPGLFMDTVLGKTVGRDLRPVKDFVYESRDGAVVNLETGEQVRPGGSAGKVKDRYQGPVVKMTTGTVNVRSTGPDGRDAEARQPEVGLIGFWDQEQERYKWQVAEVGRKFDLPGGGVMTLERPTDFSGLAEYTDTRPDRGSGGTEGAGATGGGKDDVPRISSNDDYEALPSGTEFIDPAGNRRRKP